MNIQEAQADHLVVARNWGNAQGAKGVGHSHGAVGPTGNGRSPAVSVGGRQAVGEWHEPDDRRRSRPDL
jgi:hypothetical protein